MSEKPYEWSAGAKLEEHSRRKHKILREYFFKYLSVRCQLPKREKFRLAVVDGFAGGGRYACSTPGSPLIFLEELVNAIQSVNAIRATQGVAKIEIECLILLNDLNRDALFSLKSHVEPMLEDIRDRTSGLHVRVEYLDQKFEESYPRIKAFLEKGRYRNVIFNLDQCGHSQVDRETLLDIMRSYHSVEIFYTFAIEALLSFLQKSDHDKLLRQLAPFEISRGDVASLGQGISKRDWLGAAERLVFDTFRT